MGDILSINHSRFVLLLGFSVLIVIGLIASLFVIFWIDQNQYNDMFFKAKNIDNLNAIYTNVNNIETLSASVKAALAPAPAVSNSAAATNAPVPVIDLVPQLKLAESSLTVLARTTLAPTIAKEIGSASAAIQELKKNSKDAKAIEKLDGAMMAMSTTELYITAMTYYKNKNLPIGMLMTIDTGNPQNLSQIYMVPIIGLSVLYLLMIVIFGLFESHKMAGPIYRIKNTLKDAIDGKHKLEDIKFTLRKGDELKDLVDSFNEFIEKVTKK